MTIPYSLRLICVSLATFTILFATIGAAVSVCAGAALRLAAGMTASTAARFTLLLRLLPATLAAMTVILICLPSYIRFEQRGEPEEVGLLCLALSAVTAGYAAWTFLRAFAAWRQSPDPGVKLAVVGILHPRLVIAESARNALSEGQMAMALRHEQAHAQSRDNLKRLLMMVTPGPLPGLSKLEAAWKRFAEYAADDRAVDGNIRDSLLLAEALVRVAKLGEPGSHPLTTSFLANASDLEVRVNRLLDPEPPRGEAGMHAFAVAATALSAILLTGLLWPAAPAQVHHLLEHLMH